MPCVGRAISCRLRPRSGARYTVVFEQWASKGPTDADRDVSAERSTRPHPGRACAGFAGAPRRFILVGASDWIVHRSLDLRIALIDFIPSSGGAYGMRSRAGPASVHSSRAFSVKGLIVGVLFAALVIAIYHPSPLESIITTVLILSTSSLFALFFTGSTTFTSVSGVRREVRFAFPMLIALMALSNVAGFILKLIAAR